MIKYIFLGIIQGLTEFFPVSSSGHLVIAQQIFGINSNAVAISVVLHLGTILALVLFFFKDIIKAMRNLKLLYYILIVTIITGIIGISGKHFFESLFSCRSAVAIALIITGIILILTRKFMLGERTNLGFKDAIILGLTQGIAIIPGISRSGITVSTLLFRGINRETAFRVSFIASVPAVLGAALLEAKDIGVAIEADFLNLAAGFIFSFLAGIFSLWLLKLVLAKAKLYYFGYYCIIIAAITLLLNHV